MSTAPAPDFRLSMSPRISVQRVGTSEEPVVVIDGVMRDPAALVEAAAHARYAPAFGPEGGYPGVRAPAPNDYLARLLRTLGPIVTRAFALSSNRPSQAAAMFSLVTLSPAELAPFQRIPHVDTDDPDQLAWLHFLCDEGFGGTAFYRHRATGLEVLTAADRSGFEAARDRELAQAEPPPAYPVGDTQHFEEIGAVEARFDRLIVYRSRLLHSGRILDPERLSGDPRSGRLTVNAFVVYG